MTCIRMHAVSEYLTERITFYKDEYKTTFKEMSTILHWTYLVKEKFQKEYILRRIF